MNLYLIRHAVAVPHDAGLPDDARPLTGRGRRRFREAVRGLAALDIRFDRIVHSPLLRAVQTAELLTKLNDGDFVVTPRLAETPTAEVIAELLSFTKGERTAFVGHEPWLSLWMSRMLCGLPPKGQTLPFDQAPAWKKGGVAWLTTPRPAAGTSQLHAFLPPGTLRRLARSR